MGHTRKAHVKAKIELTKEKRRERRKKSKQNKHRARLIVRNLPFAVTEENLRSHFEQYGVIDEVKILKKEDGQLVGCGFIQFNLVQNAAKARHHLNGKPFLNRDIECDWAQPKDSFQKQEKVTNVEIKKEPEDYDSDLNEIKEEIKEEAQEDLIAEQADTDDIKGEDSEEDEIEDDSDEDIDEKKSDVKVKPELEGNRPKVQSNDTVEGKTVFIKNVPFSATNADIKECFSKFGPLYYALVCMDPLTEHSKGTAFVKFRNKEDADKCIQTPDITLMGNTLEPQTALARGDLDTKTKDKSRQKHTDSRNLYLVKEGVILAGSKAAEGVSAADMTKRLQLEQYKTHMLRNLNMIVARTRLVVHNLPISWDDSKLRTLFRKHSNTKAVIKEAKVMRNMRIVDGKGIGKSKEFGFVTFTTHEAALDALRSINNNPNVFTPNKRPIVAFSIENRARLLVKDKRLHNSRIRNPKCKNYDPKAVTKNPKTENASQHHTTESNEMSKFSGVAATRGVKKMRSRFNLKTQAKLHHEQLKKEKKSKKHAKKSLKEKRLEFTKQPKQKINKNKVKESDNFSKLVSQYKKNLFGASTNESQSKKRWFS